MAMALQDESPEERDVARAMLETMGQWPPPPKPPARAYVTGFPGEWRWSMTNTTNSGNVTFSFNVVFNRDR